MRSTVALLLAASLTACGKSQSTPSTDASSAAPPTTAPPTAAPPTAAAPAEAPVELEAKEGVIVTERGRIERVRVAYTLSVPKGWGPTGLQDGTDSVMAFGPPNGGEDGPGVVGAVEWIERMKLGPEATGALLPEVRRALVIGGSNTAIDAARELAGLGVPAVSMLYRRTTQEMSGYAHELELARLAGVVLVERAVPARFVRDPQGALTAVELESGELHRCDLAVVAIGQARLRRLTECFPGLVLDERGALVADPRTGATAHPRVFAGGDAVRGGELVVTAVQDGKRAARSICAALGIEIRPDSPMRAGHE